MTTGVRRAAMDDAAAISALVQEGFARHVAPDWEPSARAEFFAGTTAGKLADRIAEATLAAVYEEDGRIVGVILLPRPTLVQLLFVAPDRLRRGIGSALWLAARTHLAERHPDVATVELNSSPYALAAYRALGFFPISAPFRRRGAVATRMACWLPGQALERASHLVPDDSEVDVRLAEARDARCLSTLATQVFLETYATAGISLALADEAEARLSVSAFAERLARSAARTLLAQRRGHLIGFAEVALGEAHALVPSGAAAELARLYVQSPFLRRGVGRRLLEHAEALALAEGAAVLWLTAWVDNERALAFYASRGYADLGRTEYAFQGEAFENRLLAKALEPGKTA